LILGPRKENKRGKEEFWKKKIPATVETKDDVENEVGIVDPG